MEAGDDQQEEEPEPERDVDLVIDHVDRQHAQTVKPDHNSESQTWNNGKEVPRWGVAEKQKMSPPTTGRCYCCC